MTREHIEPYRPPLRLEGAACRDYPVSLFFPERDWSGQALAAIAVCGGCPVRAECADWAITNREPFGIWGGLTVRERRRLPRRAAVEERLKVGDGGGEPVEACS